MQAHKGDSHPRPPNPQSCRPANMRTGEGLVSLRFGVVGIRDDNLQGSVGALKTEGSGGISSDAEQSLLYRARDQMHILNDAHQTHNHLLMCSSDLGVTRRACTPCSD